MTTSAAPESPTRSLTSTDRSNSPNLCLPVEDDTDDEDTDVKDFQSVLELAKACGAFTNIGLRWHYRSRHEDLIAFSNYKFYEGKLVTYPSSHSDGDDVGVAFYNAQGMYRRGGGADNPGEARKVAERVIEHFTNRPDLTLGVVTFSVAQADAVRPTGGHHPHVATQAAAGDLPAARAGTRLRHRDASPSTRRLPTSRSSTLSGDFAGSAIAASGRWKVCSSMNWPLIAACEVWSEKQIQALPGGKATSSCGEFAW